MDQAMISQIQSALNAMEAEDRAEDQQRRGRAKLKLLIQGLADAQRELPALEQKIADTRLALNTLDVEYAKKLASKQKETDQRVQDYERQIFSAKTKADEWTKKVTDLGVQLANAESNLKLEHSKWDAGINEKQAMFNRLTTDINNLKKAHGLQATG